MRNCVGYLPRQSFNTYGIVLLTLFGLFAVPLIAISASFAFDTSFHCHDKRISMTRELSLIKDINIKCSLKYQEQFRTHLIFGLLISNFGVVLALSIIYGYLVKHRVEKFDYSTRTSSTDNQEDENEETNRRLIPHDVRGSLGHFSTIFIYIIHLIVARAIPLLIFSTVFYQSDIPDNFSCPWTADLDTQRTTTSNSNVTLNSSYNLTMISCTNPVGGKSKTLFDVVATVDVVVVTLTFVELGYLAWLTFNDRNFITDQEFCTVYLLRKRKRIRKLVNKLRERFHSDSVFQLKDDFGEADISLRPLNDIYVNVIIQEGQENLNAYSGTFDRHRIYQFQLGTAKTVTKLTSTADMFKPKMDDGDQKYPQTILVIGRPGIGKTMLTKKLLYQWKIKEDEFWQDKIVILLQIRAFTKKNITLREMLGYGQGFSPDDFETVYETILSFPTSAVLIFDGLDELHVDSELLGGNSESISRPDKEMPVFSIFKMIVDGRLLPGVTVLITSRPTAQNVLQILNFERTVEILGFFEEQIKEYVFRFCKNDNDTAELIWNQIQGSAELFSLCYVPVNSYIVCLTLKESTESVESTDHPKTVTELYKRAVKILIHRHHPICKFEPRPIDYLNIPVSKKVENDLLELGEIAKDGIKEGKLIFERMTGSEFDKLANCVFFHKIPVSRRNCYCFLHLTLQEFLAALKVVHDMNVDDFFENNIDDPKWHLVVQFVAGLVGDKIKESAKMTKTGDNQSVIKKWQRILADLQKRLEGWVFSLGDSTASHKQNITALLAIKCLHELQNSDTMKSICSKFLAGGNGELFLGKLNITPIDSAALFEFLGNSNNLKRLTFDGCTIQGDYSYSQMEKSLFNNNNLTYSITSLTWSKNFTDQGVEHLSRALKSESCKLTTLDLDSNTITDQGVECLSEALKSENCQLTSLNLRHNKITYQSAEYLSEALKSTNCKLTSLNLRHNEITDKGVEYLSDALKSGNCKLTSLNLSLSGITYQGAEYLSEALKSENCKLTSLNLTLSGITYQGVKYLSEALKSENCKLTSLNLSLSGITYRGAQYLSKALKSENCHLTSLSLFHNEITDQGVGYLREALKSENCKLTSLNLRHNEITYQGAEYLSEALKSENCKLTSLKLTISGITYQGAEYLSEALKMENCKLTSLNLTINEITYQGVEYLSRALKSENCKLTSLKLALSAITYQGAKYLSETLKSESCKLTSLNLCHNEITDKGVEYLTGALKSENCKLTSLDLTDNKITDQGVEYLGEALKSKNCKLTLLNLTDNKITDQGAEYLTEAVKRKNCELVLR